MQGTNGSYSFYIIYTFSIIIDELIEIIMCSVFTFQYYFVFSYFNLRWGGEEGFGCNLITSCYQSQQIGLAISFIRIEHWPPYYKNKKYSKTWNKVINVPNASLSIKKSSNN